MVAAGQRLLTHPAVVEAEWRGTAAVAATAVSVVGSAVVAVAADFGTVAETERRLSQQLSLFGYLHSIPYTYC
jgi:hypothetical protein